jgi:hypothetical protein
MAAGNRAVQRILKRRSGALTARLCALMALRLDEGI